MRHRATASKKFHEDEQKHLFFSDESNDNKNKKENTEINKQEYNWQISLSDQDDLKWSDDFNEEIAEIDQIRNELKEQANSKVNSEHSQDQFDVVQPQKMLEEYHNQWNAPRRGRKRRGINTIPHALKQHCKLIFFQNQQYRLMLREEMMKFTKQIKSNYDRLEKTVLNSLFKSQLDGRSKQKEEQYKFNKNHREKTANSQNQFTQNNASNQKASTNVKLQMNQSNFISKDSKKEKSQNKAKQCFQIIELVNQINKESEQPDSNKKTLKIQNEKNIVKKQSFPIADSEHIQTRSKRPIPSKMNESQQEMPKIDLRSQKHSFTKQQKESLVRKIRQGVEDGGQLKKLCKIYRISERSYQRWSKDYP